MRRVVKDRMETQKLEFDSRVALVMQRHESVSEKRWVGPTEATDGVACARGRERKAQAEAREGEAEEAKVINKI